MRIITREDIHKLFAIRAKKDVGDYIRYRGTDVLVTSNGLRFPYNIRIE